MSLHDRLASLDAELDAFGTSDEALAALVARTTAERETGLDAIDRALEALSDDVAGLDAVLETARADAATRAELVANTPRAREDSETPTARPPAWMDDDDEPELIISTSLPPRASAAGRSIPATAAGASATPAKSSTATDVDAGEPPTTEIRIDDDDDFFGTNLFDDLDPDAFASGTDDIITNSSPLRPEMSALGDLASLLEDEEQASSGAPDGLFGESDDAPAEVSAKSPPSAPPPSPRPKSVPPSIPTPETETETETEAVSMTATDNDMPMERLSVEDLTDDLDLFDEEELEIVLDADDGEATTVSVPSDFIPVDSKAAPGTEASEGEDGEDGEPGEDGEKKGFFKKLFG